VTDLPAAPGLSGATAQIAHVDVFLVLRDRAGRLLLGLRAPHLFAGGQWNLVSGKADDDEDALSAVIREAAEEAGVTLRRSDLTPAAAVHFRNRDGAIRCGFAFHAVHDPDAHGPVVNAEPHKCDALAWYERDRLPEPLERYTAAVLAAADLPVPVAVAGWPSGER
jgi:8-oxo-dGTP diphosphatase